MPRSDRAVRADWGHSENQTITVSPDELLELYRMLLDADDRGEVAELARLGWTLFTIASSAQQAHREAVELLVELKTAARAAIAGEGSPAALALLRHVLARHGWLPPRDATPLQILAEPAP
jgi:hypothetical protein